MVAWIATPLFNNLAAQLPFSRRAAIGVLFAAAGVTLAVARLRRRRRTHSHVPAPRSSDAASALAYAGLGLLAGSVLSGDWAIFGRLAGARLAAVYPRGAMVAGIAIAAATVALLVHRSERRAAHAAAGVPGDPWIDRMESLFNTGASIVGLAFACGIVLLLVQFVVRAWIRIFPWSGIGLALLTGYLIWDGIRDRRANPEPVKETIRQLGLALAIVLGICAVLTLVLDSNYRGLTESSAVFERMAPATRLAFFAMPSVFLGVLAIGLARFAYSGHRVRVFISFHHSREETARTLERALTERGLLVGRIPFLQGYDHDGLLQQIQRELRRCTAMVCLPGAQPSFIENEVLVASTLRKFILFVVGETDPRLPNTAYYGYPVFRLERLSRQDFDPLAQLILLMAGNWRASFRHFLDGWTRHLDNGRLLFWLLLIFVFGTYVVGTAYALITSGAAEAVTFISGFHRDFFGLLGGWMVLWIWLNAFLVGSVFALIGQLRARQVLRQDILTGHLTREVLRQRMGGGKRALRLLACLRDKPLAAEHEGTG